MSMRTYGVETKGTIITLSDFQVLISLNKDSIKKTIEQKFELNDRWKEVFKNLDNMEFDDIIDFVDNINYATFIGDFNGYLDTDITLERVYFGDRFGGGEDIILIELL